MKKNYLKPVMQAMAIEATCIICTSVKSNLADGDKIKVGGGSASGGNPTARSKDRGYWDDEEEWEEDW